MCATTTGPSCSNALVRLQYDKIPNPIPCTTNIAVPPPAPPSPVPAGVVRAPSAVSSFPLVFAGKAPRGRGRRTEKLRAPPAAVGWTVTKPLHHRIQDARVSTSRCAAA